MTEPRVVVIIPAFNEEQRLPDVLRRLAALDLRAEVAVVDDASSDGTGRVAAAAGATVLRHPFNLGYGAALQTGYKHALWRGAEFVVQMDADGQHDPAHLPALLQPLRDGAADLVVGSRFLQHTGYRMGWARSLGRQVFQGLARLAGLSVTDPTSGLQALGRAAIELYARDDFPSDYPDVDVLLMAHRHGLRVLERPVQMSAGQRPSTLHGGLRAVYYVYKMFLSVFAGIGSARRGR